MRRHTIDVVFSLSLFLVFVLCSFLLLLFQINGYHEMQYDSDNLYTATSYLQTELRYNDQSDGITIEEIEGTPCLKVKRVVGVSYFYRYDGYLMELYQEEGVKVKLSLGEKRFTCDDFSISLDKKMLNVQLQRGEEKVHLQVKLKGGMEIS